MIIQREPLIDCLDELAPLWAYHYKEVEEGITHDELDVDVISYLELDDHGEIHTVIAREKGVIVGYILDTLVHNLNYQEIEAVNVMQFVVPQMRGEGIFKLMTEEMEKVLLNHGITKRYMSTKLKRHRTKNGYTAIETTWFKNLRR